jgi:hypothetical protein
MDAEEDYILKDDDVFAVEIAIYAAKSALKLSAGSPEKIAALELFLHALAHFPKPVNLIDALTFGITLMRGNKEFRESRYVEFMIDDYSFEISRGLISYSNETGSDHYEFAGWHIDLEGSGRRACELSELREEIETLLNSGAEISTSGLSEIEED